MLSRAHRLRRSAEFTTTVRSGGRAGATTLVVHETLRRDEEPTRIGFVVARSVGGAVQRNRVKRRLRHLVADRLGALPPSASLVVRANPPAAAAGYADLAADLDSCLSRARRKAEALAASAR